MVRVPGSTSPRGDVKVKGEAMGTPEPKDFVYEEKFPVKAPKGAVRDSVQKPSSIGPAAKRDPGVAEKRGRNLEREHLKGVIRDPAARSDALDAAMDYMEVEDTKKKAEKKTEKLEISALAVHGPSNDTHDEDKRFREAEVNYFRQELALLLQRDPLLLRNPRTLTIRDPLHAVTMLFCVLEDAGFKDAGSLRKCQILRRLAQREDHVGGSRRLKRLQQSPIAPAVWLKTFFTSLRTSETSLKTLRCNPSLRLPLGHTQPEYQGDLHDLSDDLGYGGGGGTGGRVAAVSTATRLRASAVSELKDFSGKEHDEEAARAWFNKLSRTARASWTDLGEQFQIHFCGKGMSLARKYYHMRRGSQEDPLDYLYRLNLAGIRANLKIHDGTKEQRREHVDHYIDTVQDDDLAGSLVVLRLPDSEALEGVLLAMRRRHQRRKIETQGSKYRQKAPAPAASSRAVRVVTTGRGRRGDQEDLEFEGESSSSDSESEDERAHVFSAARTPTPGDGEQPGARQDREDQLGRPKYGTRCSHCGSRKHTDLGCWKRLTCQQCGRMGHPTDKCFYVCKCCGDVHKAGLCKIGDFFYAVRQWYNPTRHAGLLPESVEKALN
ncbi:hypothetical protein PHYSODRAFT_246110 [Phytophthora sojae]|uniref:CCHC-type domain-containing protein n=1 Tax=Phytophthora sojae (strain P6497) TaxID=1094619 RepID=G4ZUR6_PHYSP|nr:hypothetical protein PHYSODRAFT_246110 [Phytophthora sojae]EGZ13540.1 hypothetical protein PHYSODRAFT_246110 [Phytophthora sojae]|eukprot:XP_009530969.1 hypothetical protein PHYSODRAFT_246110 [Phytophthora sojae]